FGVTLATIAQLDELGALDLLDVREVHRRPLRPRQILENPLAEATDRLALILRRTRRSDDGRCRHGSGRFCWTRYGAGHRSASSEVLDVFARDPARRSARRNLAQVHTELPSELASRRRRQRLFVEVTARSFAGCARAGLLSHARQLVLDVAHRRGR